MHMYNKENTDIVIDPKRIFQKAFNFANISEDLYPEGKEHKNKAYLALRGVSHTPYCGDH